MLKVQAVTLRSKLTGYLGGRASSSREVGCLFSSASGTGKTLAAIPMRGTSTTRCIGSTWWGSSANTSGKPKRTWSRP